MKRVFSLLLLCIVLSSCGIFRNVKKDNVDYDLKTSDKVDSNVTIEEKTLDKGNTLTVDKGVTVTERETTKTKTTPGATVKVNADLVRLKNGETISKDSAGVKISILLDSLSQNLQINIQTPESTETETMKETITENKDKSTSEQKDNQRERKESVAVTASQERKESLDIKNVEKEGKNSVWFVVLGLGVVSIVMWILYRYYKKFR